MVVSADEYRRLTQASAETHWVDQLREIGPIEFDFEGLRDGSTFREPDL